MVICRDFKYLMVYVDDSYLKDFTFLTFSIA